MMNQLEYDIVYKLIIIGNTSVGKSSLLSKFVDNVFSESFLPTIGVDFRIKNMEVEGTKVKLQVWDTAGQERFKSILTSYYKGAHGVIVVFDITDKASFQNVVNWVNES
jgi:Ras-related protein Rab-1A